MLAISIIALIILLFVYVISPINNQQDHITRVIAKAKSQNSSWKTFEESLPSDKFIEVLLEDGSTAFIRSKVSWSPNKNERLIINNKEIVMWKSIVNSPTLIDK